MRLSAGADLMDIFVRTSKYLRQQKVRISLRSHIRAHDASDYHRAQIQASRLCSCFDCLLIFSPHRLRWYNWVNEKISGKCITATCPRCGIDSIIGSASGFPINKAFLRRMQKHWFGNSHPRYASSHFLARCISFSKSPTRS